MGSTHTGSFVAQQTRKKVDALANQTAHQIHRRSSIVNRAVRPYALRAASPVNTPRSMPRGQARSDKCDIASRPMCDEPMSPRGYLRRAYETVMEIFPT